MKKLILSVVAIATVTIAGRNYQQNQNKVEMSDLALANVEALANGESGTNCRIQRMIDAYGNIRYYCVVNGDGANCTCGSKMG